MVVTGAWRMRGAASGIDGVMPIFILFTFREGRIAVLEWFEDRDTGRGRRRRGARLAWVARCSPSTAATAPGPSTRWSGRSTSSARCATRSSWTRCTTPTCSSARGAPARRRWPSCSPARSTPSGGPRADFDPEDPAAKAILAGTSLDVVEMDAASNNSVDDIRELRENVALAPMQGGRRIYILDEAHMLSTAAWNAFLKTLEEPPAHVVFVLATTEAHKVPATIVDRCHRFDFQRPVARADRGRAAQGGGRGADRAARPGDRHARPLRHRQLPRRPRHARAARHLRRQGGAARRRARHPRRGRRRARARHRRRARRAATRARRCWRCSGCPTRGATSPSSCATCRPTCATCSSCRRSARCPTRSR